MGRKEAEAGGNRRRRCWRRNHATEEINIESLYMRELAEYRPVSHKYIFAENNRHQASNRRGGRAARAVMAGDRRRAQHLALRHRPKIERKKQPQRQNSSGMA